MARQQNINVSHNTVFIASIIIESCICYNGQQTHYKYLAALHAQGSDFDSDVLHLEWILYLPDDKLLVLEVVRYFCPF